VYALLRNPATPQMLSVISRIPTVTSAHLSAL
jgi:hypothetical protein